MVGKRPVTDTHKIEPKRVTNLRQIFQAEIRQKITVTFELTNVAAQNVTL